MDGGVPLKADEDNIPHLRRTSLPLLGTEKLILDECDLIYKLEI